MGLDLPPQPDPCVCSVGLHGSEACPPLPTSSGVRGAERAVVVQAKSSGSSSPSAPFLTQPWSGAWAFHIGAHILFTTCLCGVALFPEATAPLPPLSGYKGQLVSTSTLPIRSSLKRAFTFRGPQSLPRNCTSIY